MNVELIIQNTSTGKAYEISDITKDLSLESELEETPSKLTFSIIDTNTEVFSEGSIISLKVNENKIFLGYVFTISKNSKNEKSITAYDQLRYLKYKDTYVLENLTCSEVFEKICKENELEYKVVSKSSHKLADRIEDNKTLYEMIQYAIDKTLVDKNEWFFVRDNFGTLEFLNIKNEVTNLVIGDESLLIDYDYETSIDNETYNQVKLVKENKDTKKRERYTVKDSSTIKKWGKLQYFETVDEEMNEAQINERANMLLKLYNAPEKTLSLECIGDLRVKVGCGVYLMINDLKNDVPYKKDVLVTKVTHDFKNNDHKMSLEVKII